MTRRKPTKKSKPKTTKRRKSAKPKSVKRRPLSRRKVIKRRKSVPHRISEALDKINRAQRSIGTRIGPVINSDKSISAQLRFPLISGNHNRFLISLEHSTRLPAACWISLECVFVPKSSTISRKPKGETLDFHERYNQYSGMFSTSLHYQRANRKAYHFLRFRSVVRKLAKTSAHALVYIVLNVFWSPSGARPDRTEKRSHGKRTKKRKVRK